ncbi:neuron navigator 3-like [Arapaima gigas]
MGVTRGFLASLVGVASKLRQPTVGSKPIPTAFLIPNMGRSPAARAADLKGTDSSALPCQVSVKSICEPPERRPTLGQGKEFEDSKVSAGGSEGRLQPCGDPGHACTEHYGMS